MKEKRYILEYIKYSINLQLKRQKIIREIASTYIYLAFLLSFLFKKYEILFMIQLLIALYVYFVPKLKYTQSADVFIDWINKKETKYIEENWLDQSISDRNNYFKSLDKTNNINVILLTIVNVIIIIGIICGILIK